MSDSVIKSPATKEEEEAELRVSLEDNEVAEQISELLRNYESDLLDLPYVLEHIEKLKKIIKKQQKKLNKFYTKLKDHRLRRIVSTTDASTQTELKENPDVIERSARSLSPTPLIADEPSNSWAGIENITEEVKQVAEQAMSHSGFVYEPTSGMYYDYKTGYYYNAELRQYYDGNSGQYLVYDEESKQYKYQEQPKSAPYPVAKEIPQPDEMKTVKRKREEETEEGEVSDSSDDESETADRATFPVTLPVVDSDVSSNWPPCLRLMVTESSVTGIAVGRLFLVTYEGGEVGREGDLAVLLPEPAVSKVQLKISYTEDSYRIVDMGSRNGTFLNGKRISAALQESSPAELHHGDVLKIGSTSLSVHIHRGSETCNACEPGLLLQAEPPPPLPASLPMRDLKKRLGVNKTSRKSSTSTYTDRALRRREEVGSSHPAEKTEAACVQRAIGSENKGFKMLEKMGWSSGQKLGVNDHGLAEPVPLVGNIGSVGLGASSVATDVPVSQTKASRRKQHMLKTTRARYEQPPVKPPDDDDEGDGNVGVESSCK